MTATALPATHPVSRTARAAIAAAAGLGLAGDILFKDTTALGLNGLLWVSLLAFAWHRVAAVCADGPRAGQGRWLLVAVGFASCFAIRDAGFIKALDAAAILTAFGLPALAHFVEDQRRARLRDICVSLGCTAILAMFGPMVLFFSDADWSRLRSGPGRRAGPLIAGLALAVPIVLVFGALFSSADPTFAGFASRLTDWDLGPLMTHAMIVFAFAWLAAGMLRAWLFKTRALPIIQGGDAVTLSATSIGMAVGAMVMVFLVFVAIQARYLFGGAALVESVTGLTYAEYARRGFFEMVAASGLAFPVLYAADMVLQRDDARATRNVRALGTVQLLLVGVVMVSAALRLKLYMDAYGLTEDRITGAAILAWLGGCAGWFANTVLRGRRERFPFGALVGGFAVLAALNAVNPHALIARVNTSRSARGGTALDAAYLGRLSRDAAPFLLSHLDRLTAEERCLVTLAARTRWNGWTDWRGWSVARSRAVSASAGQGMDGDACHSGVGVTP